MTPPVISVIVPVYNVQDHVAACIESLKAQSFEAFEAVVVNDGSTDNSGARLRAAIGDDPRFRVIEQSNQGLSAARNTALDVVQGEFIAFLDSDDRYAPRFLEWMHAALAPSQADWIACAIRMTFPDGDTAVHSAIHGSGKIKAHPELRTWPMERWTEVIPHFPSAWNKLYRRSLIGDLRFDVGTYYEDHAFYYRAAARTKTLMHLPLPLYLHTRGREGQITNEASDRVFEQISVLDTMSRLITEDKKPEAKLALQRIATRLTLERASCLKFGDRRRKLAQASQAFFDARDLTPDTSWDKTLSPFWPLEMAGRTPISVIVTCGDDVEAVQTSLTSLEKQTLSGFDVVLTVQTTAMRSKVAPLIDAKTLPQASVLVLDSAAAADRQAVRRDIRGAYLMQLHAGDTLPPKALAALSKQMLKQQADVALIPFGDPPSLAPHWCVPRKTSLAGKKAGPLDLGPADALILLDDPTGKIYDRAFLDSAAITLDRGAHLDRATMMAAVALAQKPLQFQKAYITQGDGPPHRPEAMTPDDTFAALDALARAMPNAAQEALPDGWYKRLAARDVQRQLAQVTAGTVEDKEMRTRISKLLAARKLHKSEAEYDADFDEALSELFSVRWPRLARNKPVVRRALTPAPEAEPASEPEPQVPDEGPDDAAPDINTNMTAFAVAGTATLRYRVQFGQDPFANVSFFDARQRVILFHLSIRAEEGRLVCNRRGEEHWEDESDAPFELGAGTGLVQITFDRDWVRVHFDDRCVFDFPASQDGRSFPDLDQIRFVDFQGGVVPASLDLDCRLPDQALNAPLVLSPRLDVRGYSDAEPRGPTHLTVDGSEVAPRIIRTTKAEGGTPWRAVLPGRVWSSVAADAALCLRVDGHDEAHLSLTRSELARHIEATCDLIDLRCDAFAASQVFEHVKFASIWQDLSEPAQTNITRAAATLGLEAYLDVPAPAVVPPKPDIDLDAVHAVLRRLAPALRDAKADLNASFDAIDLPDEEARVVYLALVEAFCLRDDLHPLMGWAERAGLGRFDLGDGGWYNSAILPHLFWHWRWQDVVHALNTIANAPGDWAVTPAVAWVARAALTGRHVDEQDREEILYAVLTFLDLRADAYWERAQCHSLIEAMVELLAAADRLSPDLGKRISEVAVRTYGLSRQFWWRMEARQVPLTGDLTEARETFDALRLAVDCDDRSEPQSLITSGAADAERVVRDWLGCGRPVDMNLLPAVRDEALIRHYAQPGAPDMTPAEAEQIAAALPQYYEQSPASPFAPLLKQTVRKIQGRLAQKEPLAAHQVHAFGDALHTLAGHRSHYVGIGLALLLCEHAEKSQGDEVADASFWLLQSLVPPLDDPRMASMCLCPTVRAALTRIARRDADHRVLQLFPPLDAPERRDGPDLACDPLFDTLVVVFSCKPNLETRVAEMRAGWLSQLRGLGIPYVVVVGDGGNELAGDVLALDVPDDYEGLPQKTLATIKWVHDNTEFAHILKVDDDCFVNVAAFFLGYSFRKFDYYGRRLTRWMGQMDRAWHMGKSTSKRGQLQLDKSPEPSTYADGGSGYTLSRRAMAAVLRACDSAEGQHLIETSFMEDKLLGDLLSLHGIEPHCEDYHIAIRRRTHADARPVSLWVNSFDASVAAPVKLVHMDTHVTQRAAMETLQKPVLTPRKIWPSFQPVRLEYQSNALELISDEAQVARAREADVSVIACMRNEMFMLPHFLSHYRALGVESFLIADNCSDDGTLEYLADQPDVALFSVDTDYSQSHYGVAWQQALMSNFRVNRWSLVADADELLVWQTPQKQTLPELLKHSDFEDAEGARVFMLDLYPRGQLQEATFASGDLFAEAGFVDRVPFLADWPGRGPYSNATTWTSALRHRLIPGSRPDLFVAQKLALVKYRPWMRFSDGLHYVSDMKVAKRELLFGHFKYNADFRRKAQAEVARRQHFNNAEEYQKYLAVLSEGRDVIFDPSVSIYWTDCGFVTDRLQFT